jgi:CubicO group peptidase (beta-lactamase class C family)
MSPGGMSQTRLERMHDVMANRVEHGAAAGVVFAVGRRGEAHLDAIGTQDLAGGAPMRHDTIFRIASMTEPIAAAAAMVLVEECKLRLDERPRHVRSARGRGPSSRCSACSIRS